MRKRPIYKDQCQELNKTSCAIVIVGTQIFGPSPRGGYLGSLQQ